MLQGIIDHEVEQIVVVEVKCFSNPQSELAEIYTAVGQYLYYRGAIIAKQLALPLYLGIPAPAYDRLMTDPALQVVFTESHISMIVVDLEKEEVITWIH